MVNPLGLLFDVGLLAIALGLSILIRVRFVNISSRDAVDHFYWILVARLFRGRFKLPLKMDGKYLLEDDRLSYPLGFGFFLSRFSENFLRSPKSNYITLTIDLTVLLLLFVLGVAIGLNGIGLGAVVLVYGIAPVLVSYNTQLTSRSLGNLFLICSLIFQTLAAKYDFGFNLLFGFLGVVALAAVFATHKMTTQFYLFLLPGWFYSIMSFGEHAFFIAIGSPFFALLLLISVTGFKQQKLQWMAHREIISFWYRNWPFLGAHQFRDSPIYGTEKVKIFSRFHLPGMRGVVSHCSLLFAYLPLAFFLPITLLVTPPPADLIFIPAIFAVVIAASTLLIPQLKCLGGGHLYMFNAVPFVSIWWGMLLSEHYTSFVVVLSFVVGVCLTLVCLFIGAKRRALRDKDKKNKIGPLIEYLSNMPKHNVAIFPVQHAEKIALETPHSVFWGAHGLGFKKIEPYWPVMRKELGQSMRTYGIKTTILDLDFWPEGETMFARETGDKCPQYIGKFVVFKVS